MFIYKLLLSQVDDFYYCTYLGIYQTEIDTVVD